MWPAERASINGGNSGEFDGVRGEARGEDELHVDQGMSRSALAATAVSSPITPPRAEPQLPAINRIDLPRRDSWRDVRAAIGQGGGAEGLTDPWVMPMTETELDYRQPTTARRVQPCSRQSIASSRLPSPSLPSSVTRVLPRHPAT